MDENGAAVDRWDGNLKEMNGESKPSETEDTSHPRVYINAPELPGSQRGEDPHVFFLVSPWCYLAQRVSQIV